MIAAGGIADGRGLIAALALGASGVLCGTAFFASDESLASENAKQAALSCSGDDTERSSVFDMARSLDWPAGWKLRTMRNDFTRRWSQNLNGLARDLKKEQIRFQTAHDADDTSIAPVIVGEAADLIYTREPVLRIIDRMVAETNDGLQKLCRLISS